jgi:phosphoglycolate phosphatase
VSSDTIYTMNNNKRRGKIILFDLDGTLIDSTEAILESFGVAYDSFDAPVPSDEAITSLIGLPLDAMFLSLGISKEEVNHYVHAYKMHYRTIHTQKTTLLPSAKEAIQRANQFARLGVVTTKTSEYSRTLLDHFGILPYFDVLIGREDVANPKPHPEPIYKALKALAFRFGEITYMVGDTTADILSAQEADIGSIGVLTGYMSEEELDEEADFIASNALEAVKLIESL